MNVTLKMRCDCMARQSTALGRAALEIKSGLLTLRTGATVEVTQSDKDDEGYRVMMFPIGDLKFKV